MPWLRSTTLAAVTLLAATALPTLARAHDTGTENTSASQCSVLPGTSLHGPQAECLRCVGREHYHFHSDLPLHQRCHREHHNPAATHTHAHAHAHHH